MQKSIRHPERGILIKLLRETRVEAGFTQTELAKRLHRPQAFVSNYERGQRKLDLLELKEICAVLGLTLMQFVKRFEQATS